MQLALKRPARPPATDVARAAHPVIFAAAMLSLGAGWVHLAYMESHLRQWWAYGAFFLATGAGQALYAPVLIRWPRPRVLWAGIAGNLAIVAMYIDSRTLGVPWGPHAHIPEIAGTVDLATTAAELGLVALLISLLGGTARRGITDVLLVTAALLMALRLTGHLA